MLAFMLHKGFYMAALGGACVVRAYCRLSKECYLPNQVAVEWKNHARVEHNDGRCWRNHCIVQGWSKNYGIANLRDWHQWAKQPQIAFFRGNGHHDLPGPKICSGWSPIVSPRAIYPYLSMFHSWRYERTPPRAFFWAWKVMSVIASEQRRIAHWC